MSIDTAPVIKSTNPFVGPRSFTRAEKLYGRDREVRELLNLIIADRIVLCCSPSGAGKTSLIEAGLAPKLDEEGFLVLPTVRLKQEPPAGPTVNRYTASALVCLGAPAEQLGGTLRGYLDNVPIEDGKTGLLLFDQFEEVLSLDPTDASAKREFFSQLGDALRDRRWWALFAMREDFLAALDPYLPLLPTRLSTRFRLDLLGPDAARQVVTRTVEAAGRTFAEDASAALVTELSRMVDGRIGPYIEPVQLQVVCRQLWERLPPGVSEITAANMGDVGDVDGALAAYYAREVREAADATNLSERAVRDWFERQLITDNGFRGQAQAGPGADGSVLRLLQDSHLVRAETRRGTTWYELAHDRLVAPVQAANKAWREQHLVVFQRQAELWEEQGRRDDLLVTDEILDQGEALAAEPDSQLTAAEQAFLGACRKAHVAAEREKGSIRRTRRLLALTSIALVVAVIATAVAGVFYQKANRGRGDAESGERLRLAFPALDAVSIDPNLSVHLALQALAKSDEVKDQAGLDAQEALARRVYGNATVGLTFPARGVRRVAFSPDGDHLATAGEEGSAVWGVRTWAKPVILDSSPVVDVAFGADRRTVATARKDGSALVSSVDGEEVRVEWSPPDDPTKVSSGAFGGSIAFSGDGRRLAIAGGRGAFLWEWRQDSEVPLDSEAPLDSEVPLDSEDRPAVTKERVRSAALSPDGSMLATAGDDAMVRLWETATTTEPRILPGHVGPVNDVAFSPDGRHLVTGGEDGTARLWDVASGELGRTLSIHDAGVNDVAFSRDGKRVATASDDGTAMVVDPATGRKLAVVAPGTGAATGVAFDPAGSGLAVATADGAPAVWDVSAELPPGHREDVYAVAFSPEGDRLATASADRSPAIWDMEGRLLSVLNGHEDEVNAVRFGAAGVVVTASDDTTAKLWNSASGRELRTFSGHQDLVYDVAVSPDGARLATASQDGTARVWDIASGTEARPPLKAEAPLNGVAFSPDGRRLATAGDDGSPTVWDIASGRPQKYSSTGDETEWSSHRVAFSPDGALLAASTDAGTVVWDTATGRVTKEFPGSLPLIAGVAFSPDGRRIVGADGVVRDVATGTGTLDLGSARGVAFSPDGSRVATAGEGATARLWDSTSGRRVATLGSEVTGHLGGVVAVATDRSGRRLATAGMDGTARVWDDSGRLLATLTGHDYTVNDVGLTPDGRLLVTGGEDGTARLWDVASGEQLSVLAAPGGPTRARNNPGAPPSTVSRAPRRTTDADDPEDAVDPIAHATFAGDGNTVVTAGFKGGAWVWDVTRPSAPRLVRTLAGQVIGLSDNGRWTAIQRDRALVVVDTRSDRARAEFPSSQGFDFAAVSADGKRLVVADAGRLLVGDAGEGSTRRLRKLPEALEYTYSFAISPDGRSVAAAGEARIVVWDARSGRVTFEADNLVLTGGIAFAPDGRLVAGRDEGPELFAVELATLKRLALARAARPLTNEECRRYLQTKAPCTPLPPVKQR